MCFVENLWRIGNREYSLQEIPLLPCVRVLRLIESGESACAADAYRKFRLDAAASGARE